MTNELIHAVTNAVGELGGNPESTYGVFLQFTAYFGIIMSALITLSALDPTNKLANILAKVGRITKAFGIFDPDKK